MQLLLSGRWSSTSKEQLLRMIEFSLRESQPPSCTGPDHKAGKVNRHCPIHGSSPETTAIDAEDRIAEELATKERVRRLRAVVSHIHRLAANDGAMEKAAMLGLLDRLIRPSGAYEWLDED